MSRSIVMALVMACALSAGAVAQTADEQAACTDDAFRICSHAIPDRERTFQCMIAQRDALSAACRTAIAAHLPPEPAPPRAKRAKPLAKSASTQGQGTSAARRKQPVDLNPSHR
jgi:hypothetical protein